MTQDTPITLVMRKFLDDEDNAIALGSTLDAVASMRRRYADETASASVVRREVREPYAHVSPLD